jgi:quercetin dioxygenase-like cupin family protein
VYVVPARDLAVFSLGRLRGAECGT